MRIPPSEEEPALAMTSPAPDHSEVPPWEPVRATGKIVTPDRSGRNLVRSFDGEWIRSAAVLGTAEAAERLQLP